MFIFHLQAWGAPIAEGDFKLDDSLHAIHFSKPVETRFVNFVVIRSFDPKKPYASLAELSVVKAG